MLNNPRTRTLLRICSFFALVTAVFYTSTFLYAYIYDAINTPVVADELYDACFELPTIEPTGSWSLSGEKERNEITTTKKMHDLCGGGCLHSTWDPFSLDFEMNCSHDGTYVYEGDMAIRDGLKAHEKRYHHKVTHHNRSDFIYSYCPSSPCKSKHNLIVRNKYYNKIWQRAKKDEKKFLEKVKKRNEKKGVKPPPTPIKRPNVVHLLIDSVSKEAFYRRLPNFANYLTSLNDSGRFDVVEFQKFHVIGLNSPANQIPIMTGHHQVDDWATESYIYKILRYFSGDRQICSPFRTQLNTDLPLKLSEDSIQTTSALLWKKIQEMGYVSMYTEEICLSKLQRLMSFTNRTEETEGISFFGYKPFFYPHAGEFEAEGLDYFFYHPFCLSGNPLKRRNKKGERPKCSCFAGKFLHTYALDYTLQFFLNYHYKQKPSPSPSSSPSSPPAWEAPPPKFAWVSLQEGHEGTMQVLGTMDWDLVNFFKKLDDPRLSVSDIFGPASSLYPPSSPPPPPSSSSSSSSSHFYSHYSSAPFPSSILNDTVFIISSDHGLNYGNHFIFETAEGWLEHKNPMLWMVAPKWFLDQTEPEKAKQIREILKENSQKIITPFDLYKTFLHFPLLGLEDPKGNPNEPDLVNDITHNKDVGFSLLEEIPVNRNCENSLVPDLYCLDKVKKRQVCWTSLNDCELKAEEDRLAFSLKFLFADEDPSLSSSPSSLTQQGGGEGRRVTKSLREIYQTAGILPSREAVTWIRRKQMFVDFVLTVGGLALIIHLLLFCKRRREANERKERKRLLSLG